MGAPKAFYIPVEKNFLEELALGIINRFDNIAEISILLPSNRSCIEFKKILRNYLGTNVLLPKIIPIGELGKKIQIKKYPFFNKDKKCLSESEHILFLTNIIYKKTKKKISYLKALDTAKSLSGTIKMFTKNNIPLTRINILDFPDAATHTEELIQYLQIIINEWPSFLLQNNFIDFLNDSNIYIEYLLQEWKCKTPDHPIIIAGSTGSITSTSNLIKALSDLPKGFVILTSLDFDISDEHWDALGEHHHNFLTKQLIKKIGISRYDLVAWHSKSSTKTDSQKFISECMVPSNTLTNWHNFTLKNPLSITPLKIIDCHGLQEEASLITLQLKEILHKNPDANIAVVTNNTDLIDRILLLSKSWKLNIYNSYGKPLYKTLTYTFIISLINAISSRFSPSFLLTLLKHPLFIIPVHNFKDAIVELEIKYLRGVSRYDDLRHLINITARDQHSHISDLLIYLENYCSNLIQIPQGEYINFKDTLEKVIIAAQNISMCEGETLLWLDNEGSTLYKHLHDILSSSHFIEKVQFCSVQNILKTLVQDISTKDTTQSNIKILSTIESRLLSFDNIIISGLNEGDWPAKTNFDLWFNNNAYETLGLHSPQQIIGQAAYDFFCLLHHKEVLLTRSIIYNGSITIPTRWLVRMEILAKKLTIFDQIKQKNPSLKTHANSLLYRHDIQDFFLPNLPKPYKHNALNKLSVTKLEKLIRDPYNIYVSEILKLKKLEAVDKQPDQKDFGIFIHAVMDSFNKLFNPRTDLKDLLIKISKDVLASITENLTIQHLWKLKFEQMIEWIIEFETSTRKSNTIKIFTESKGKISIDNDFVLTMKADRIEIDDDIITIIDFKTGTIPTQQDIQQGFSPQLPLEALILQKGLIKELSHINTNNKDLRLLYIQLIPGRNFGKITSINITPEISTTYLQKNLAALIHAFNSGSPFLVCPRPDKSPKYNDIFHLERKDD